MKFSYKIKFSLIDSGMMMNASASMILWTVNIMILFCCLVKLLVYGDPVMSSKSQAAGEYWKHKNRADLEFAKVS